MKKENGMTLLEEIALDVEAGGYLAKLSEENLKELLAEDAAKAAQS